jgi:translation initiation factor 1A
MPNRGGGKKHKRGKGDAEGSRELQFAGPEEQYALVNKMLGGSNIEVLLAPNDKRIARIRGSLRNRRSWVRPGDLVLVGIRPYEENKVDMIHTYTPDEHMMLKSYGELHFQEDGTAVENSNADSAGELEFDIDAV